MLPRRSSWRARRSATFVVALIAVTLVATAVINFMAFTVEQDVGRERTDQVERMMSHLDEIEFDVFVAVDQLDLGDSNWVSLPTGALPLIRRRVEELRVDLNGLYGADTDLWSHAGHWFGRILNAVLLLLGIRFTKEEVSEALPRWLRHRLRNDIEQCV
jgi:hypothetical protein